MNPATGGGSDAGLLYVVTDSEVALDECAHSARTFRKYCPEIQVQLVTNMPLGSRRVFFDFVDALPLQLHPHKAKVLALQQTRFERTLFLDADTEVRGPVYELFEFLKRYDFGLTCDNDCDWTTYPFRFIAQESSGFNTGLLLFRRTEPVMRHLRRWFELFRHQDDAVISPGHFCDQHYFNVHVAPAALSDDSLRIVYLPNTIYNVRPWCIPELRRQQTTNRIRIYHAHDLHAGTTARIRRRVRRTLRALLGSRDT
jgi:hypothetical protein